QTVGLVMGCQGGFHVWTAVRAHGIDPRSPIIDLTMTRARDALPVSMIFHVRSTLSPVAGSDWTEGYGYRLQVNARDEVLNEDVVIHLTVTDREGLTATDMRTVHVVDGGSACTTLDGSFDFDGPVPRDPDAGVDAAATDQ